MDNCNQSDTTSHDSGTVSGLNWLSMRMPEVGIGSISELATKSGINKGTLSKYFRGIQRPSIDAIPPLCRSLEVSPATLLAALGVIIDES